jgi:uncharacterized protein (DUF2344 family)
MAKQKRFEEIIRTWSTEYRIEIAKERTRALTDRVIDVIEIHAANEIIVYSDRLSDQIPLSYAGHAFTTFRDTQFKFEIISLTALWDTAASNTVSIPTVVELIDDKDVISEICKRVYSIHANAKVGQLNRNSDLETQQAIDGFLRQSQVTFAKEQSLQASKVLQRCVGKTRERMSDGKHTSIRNLRDKVSHSLTQTRREERGPVANLKYGDEKQLLLLSIDLIEDLYCWVNGTGFDIKDDCFAKARKQAEELWTNCAFEIPDRRG